MMLKFGITKNDVIIQPLVFHLNQQTLKHDLQIELLSAQDVLSGLLSNRLQAGFVTPLQYAQSQDKLAIVRDFVVATPQYGRNCLLFFQEDLRNIHKVYFPGNIDSSYELFLAKLILGEHFEIDAEWETVYPFPKIEEALEQFPVLLLTGSEAFRGMALVENYIDLTEEWSLKTQSPLVHRLLTIRRDLDALDLIKTMQLTRELGLRNLKKISQQLSAEYDLPWGIFHDLFSGKYRFAPDESTWEALKEILQFVFYYGETEYYPEIHFFEK